MKNEDKPAFPTDYNLQSHWVGLTKREWYAGMALMGMAFVSYEDEDVLPKEFAKKSFILADAMIKEGGRV